MGRRKIEIKAIKDDRNRSVTFLKRKGGLFKKAHELSVLCSVDVAVIIFGHNKKLYEFSSGDIRETLGRYSYYGPPHEHKGPHDFSGGGGDDDEEDDEDITAEEMGPSTQNMIPPQLQNQPGYQHMNHAPSTSPPIPNGMAFAPRHGTPQPQNSSRPSSRNHVRQMSYGGHNQAHATPPPPANPNGYAYMAANPSMYNPNANSEMNNQPQRQGQYHQFAHPSHPGAQQQQAQSIPQHHRHAPPPQVPHHGLPTHQHQSMPHVHQQYMQDQGRHSLPPSMPQDSQQQYQYRTSLALPDPAGGHQPNESKDGGSSPKSKSRSIFTPIDDQTSVFSRHLFGNRATLRESPQRDTSIKEDSKPTAPASQTLPLPNKSVPPPLPPNRSATEPQRSLSTPSLSDSQQPARSKPRLKVQIPSEQSDSGSVTGDSSPHESTAQTGSTSAKKSDTGTAGVVQLPPPPPSPGGAGGPLLSAGAQGPPNPFARPAPPASNTQNGTSGYAGSSSSSSNQNMETPISALPSRFVSDALLPSPSSFFPEWGFGRTGPDTSILPSPLPFTPAVQTAPGLPREEDAEKKRKNSDAGVSADAGAKKVKT